MLAPSGKKRPKRETGERNFVISPAFLKDIDTSEYTPSFNKVNIELWQKRQLRRTGGYLPKVIRTKVPHVRDPLSDRCVFFYIS